ncbi:MAG: 3-mercaptopyruvate sulfurtransferase [Alphaproteobacteria bacterium]|nr:3-mercaptopyruvate sulfurtransferase [Alphaproteobacteria bacterium]
MTDALVTTEWLEAHLDAPDVRVVDASYYLKIQNRDPKGEFADEHIPGAVFFDIDEIADETSSLPHMLPTPEKFAAKMRKLGLGDGNRIVVYDTNGGGSAACRAWWMFRVFGHREVSVLDGGFPKWLREQRPVTDQPTPPRERHFTARVDTTLVREVGQILANLETGREQVVDARSPGRWRGTDPELWPVNKVGRIPGSLNLPFVDLIDGRSKTFLSPEVIRERFQAAGVDLKRPIVASCGSGVTACVLALGLHLIGRDDAAIYDGSWVEWGNRDDTPVETN